MGWYKYKLTYFYEHITCLSMFENVKTQEQSFLYSFAKKLHITANLPADYHRNIIEEGLDIDSEENVTTPDIPIDELSSIEAAGNRKRCSILTAFYSPNHSWKGPLWGIWKEDVACTYICV